MSKLIKLIILIILSIPLFDGVTLQSPLVNLLNICFGMMVVFDLLYIAVNALYADEWKPLDPRTRFDGLDATWCLVWSALTLTPWGLLAVLADAATKFFARWAQALKNATFQDTLPNA